MRKRIRTYCIVFLKTIVASYSQTSLKELKQVIFKVDSSWIISIDTVNKNKHSALVSGESIGILKFKKNGDEFEYYIYTAFNNRFSTEIEYYHKFASCAFTTKKYRNLKYKKYILFLPMYPCWTGGYSEEEKKLIEKLVITFN